MIMQNSKFKMALAEALIPEYEASIPQMEEHIFSKRFERRMKKLINRRRKPYYKLINKTWKRAVYAVTAAAVSMTIVMQVEAVRSLFKDFLAYIYEKFSVLQSVDSTNAPETIEDVYVITYNLSDYVIDYEKNNGDFVNVTYRNNDVIIDYFQYTKINYYSLWNTEDTGMEKILIGDFEAVYFNDNHNFETVVWDNGEYIFSISSNIGKNALIDIAKSVQKVE